MQRAPGLASTSNKNRTTQPSKNDETAPMLNPVPGKNDPQETLNNIPPLGADPQV